ncbi:MAG: hypothetical protein HYR81_01830 [Nitrospirae bacterium]|nr:hypothetical protein [Nitrospirota bacterium]
MLRFERIEEVSYEWLVKLLPVYLPAIRPGLMILADRMTLDQEDGPFLLVLNSQEKRVGTIEILKSSAGFPGQILSHAAWIANNSLAIAHLNKKEFDPSLSPFVIGLVPNYPQWANLCSFLTLDISLFKYSAVSCEETPGLILDPIFGPSPSPVETDQPQPREVKISTPFRSEGVNELGLTEAELRFFSS